MRPCMVAGIAVSALIAAAPVAGQEPRTDAGARAAAIALVRARPGMLDSIPVVGDSVSLHNELVHCETVPTAEPACTMVEGKQVVMVLARVTGATTASVEVRYYQVMHRSCPLGRPVPTPIIGYTRTEAFAMGYSAGRWKPVGSGRVVEC